MSRSRALRFSGQFSEMGREQQLGLGSDLDSCTVSAPGCMLAFPPRRCLRARISGFAFLDILHVAPFAQAPSASVAKAHTVPYSNG